MDFDEHFPKLSPLRFGNKDELRRGDLKDKIEDKLPSFAAVVTGINMKMVLGPPIEVREATFEEGIPVVSFTSEDIDELQKPFGNCIVAKFSKVRAELGIFRNWIKQKRDLQGDLFVCALDSRHILLNFASDEEFIKVYSMGDIKWNDEWVSLLRWSPYFRPNLRSTEFPVTVGLPGINLHLQNVGVLQSIAKALGGRFLTVEEQGSMSYAKFRMELDLMKERQDWVIIQNGDQRFNQRIVYENVPPFCEHCCLKGHLISKCRDLNKPKVVAQPKVKKIWIEKGKEAEISKGDSETKEKSVLAKVPEHETIAEEEIVSKAKARGKEVMEVLEVSEDEDEERLRYKNKLGELVISSWPKENILEVPFKENEEKAREKKGEVVVGSSKGLGLGTVVTKETQTQVLEAFLNTVIVSAADSLFYEIADEALKDEIGAEAEISAVNISNAKGSIEADTPMVGEKKGNEKEKRAEEQSTGKPRAETCVEKEQSKENSGSKNSKPSAEISDKSVAVFRLDSTASGSVAQPSFSASKGAAQQVAAVYRRGRGLRNLHQALHQLLL